MAVERYIAAASLGLFAMFAGEMVTVYSFMVDPPIAMFEPLPKLLQFVSIGAAPAAIMAGVSYIMSRRYGSRPVGTMIVAGGASMLAGAAYTTAVLVGRIQPEFAALDAVVVLPPVIAAVSVPVMVTGMLLFRIKKRRVPKSYS